MENFSYSSYPDSGDSSPRSREIEFENPPPWDDQPPPPAHQSYKAKFMCSYGGKILPRPHDNQLCYIGGETKILAVDRTVKFAAMISKLSALCESDVSFKYQLPGEDLDALISVTNDDDLEHMMHEYDRLYRATAKPARMRLFLFPVVVNSAAGSFVSDGPTPDRDQFVDALNLVPGHGSEPAPKPPGSNNVDFLFGLEKGVGTGVGVAAPPPPPPTVPEPLVQAPEFQVRGGVNRVVGSNPPVNPVEIQRQLHELQKLQMEHDHNQQQQQLQQQQMQQQQEAMYRRKSDDSLVGGYPGGDYYVQKQPEKIPAMAAPPPGYWPEKQVASGGFPATVTAEHPVYMIPAPGGAMYHHQQMAVRQVVTGPAGQPPQAYYPVQQRMASDVYREQPVYNVVQQPPPPQPQQPPLSVPPPQNLPPQPPKLAATYPEGMGIVRPSGGGGGGGMGVANTDAGQYTQVAYDSATGRQVFYTAPAGMVLAPSPAPAAAPPQQTYAPVATDMRPGGSLGQEAGKVVVNKVSQASV
ncbi:PB1 domain containing protein [Trema orientale]|uniref:PB1 domain containing protein n=1 Tax=Trema orientale TaxID=63057 RepID=A0A2P5F7D8_TREOI|nr:PB1 domain containing protein [Trema orientale]